MRALHLIGMRGAGGKPLRFYPSDQSPLILPSWLPVSDRETILAFYQQILGESLLPRVEIDWYRSLVAADRSYLGNICARHGAEEHLVVVKVRREGVTLEEVLSQPELLPFEHVAVAADHPLEDETFGKLTELTRFVLLAVEELYDEMADELSMRPDGNALVAPLVRTLIDPVLVVDTYNALVDVHAEGVAAGEQGRAIFRRILGKMLADTPPQVAVGLGALVLRGMPGFEEAVTEERRSEVLAALRARMLIRDEKLTGWAHLLEDEWLREVIQEQLRGIVRPRRGQSKGAKTVLGWFEHREPRAPARGPSRDRVLAVFDLLNKGEVGRARDELAALESELSAPGVTDETRGDFWDAVGRLRASESRWEEAEQAYRRSLDLLERAGATLVRRGITMDVLARGLRDSDRWKEAEPLFRGALRLKEEGGATPTSRGITMHELARGLRDNGRWKDAEPLFREALRLKEEGGATPTSRGITVHALAYGLRDNGRWQEAEPLFREALRLKEEGGDTPTGRGITMHELARGLLDNGRWKEAEPLFREALRLKKEGGAPPASRGITMHELARGLLDDGRWKEAEPLFREALRFAEESGDTPKSRAMTMRELARGLRKNGRAGEAARLEAKAKKLEAGA